MQNNDLEFDHNKNALNKIKHNDIDFEEAYQALCDDFAITTEDYGDYDGEQRYFSIAMSSKFRILIVNWTIRNDNMRVISARLAEPNQRKIYENRRRFR